MFIQEFVSNLTALSDTAPPAPPPVLEEPIMSKEVETGGSEERRVMFDEIDTGTNSPEDIRDQQQAIFFQ